MTTELKFEVVRSTLDGVLERVKDSARVITIGVHEDAEPYPDGTPVATVYAAQEFGTLTIPPRPSLRAYFDGGGAKAMGDAAKKALGEVVDRSDPDVIAEAVGELAVAGVKSIIESGIAPSLKDDTSRTPLIDTGHLLDSITFQGDR